MNKQKSSLAAVFQRGRDFAVAHRPGAPAKPPLRYDEHVNTLSAVIRTMEEAGTIALGGAVKLAGIELRLVRRKLWEEMVQMRELAYGLNYDDPGLIIGFRVPHPTARLSHLLDTARQILKQARENKAVFTENGWPEDFIEQLESSINRVVEARSALNNSKNARVEAFETLEEASINGRRAMAYLNGVFGKMFANNPEMLAAWNAAQQVEYRRNPKGPVLRAGHPAFNDPETVSGLSRYKL